MFAQTQTSHAVWFGNATFPILSNNPFFSVFASELHRAHLELTLPVWSELACVLSVRFFFVSTHRFPQTVLGGSERSLLARTFPVAETGKK